MRYIFGKVMRTLWWNRWISILMIVEIALGMSVFVYSMNLYYSLSKEESERRRMERDLVLEITSDGDYTDSPCFTRDDYEKIQKMTGGMTFFYAVLPWLSFEGEEKDESWLVFLDYGQMGLEEGFSYWGEGVRAAEKTDMPLTGLQQSDILRVFDLQMKEMPEILRTQKWKTEDEEIILENCMTLPLKCMERMQDEIYPAAVHVEWSSSKFPDVEETSEKIEEYLCNVHGDEFYYRVYSPGTELRSNAQKVKISIGILNKAGILGLLTFSFGMMAIFGLMFEHREEEFGIDLACGADYGKLFLEIFLEIFLLNGVGAMLGFCAGWILTYYIDLGIMIGAVKVQGDIRTCIFGCAVCAGITGAVSALIFKKLKNREIVGLLKGN